MPKSVVAHTVEGDAVRVGKVDLWLPERHNQERTELNVSTAWLAAWTCPEHPLARHWNGERMMGFTHYRAAWSREWLANGHRVWRPCVEFRCPRGHIVKVVANENG